MNYTKEEEEESLVGFDSFGRRRLWKARSFNRILKGNLISGPRVKLRV